MFNTQTFTDRVTLETLLQEIHRELYATSPEEIKRY